MRHKTYNTKYYKSLKKLIYEGKFDKALQFLNDYMKKYPNDYRANYIYIEMILESSNLEYAKEVLNDYCQGKEKKKFLALYCEMKILLYDEQYQLILDKIKDINNTILKNQMLKN